MAFYSWCEERLQVQSLADDILSKYVPAHVNLFYCFGGIVFVSFLIQGVTGFCLTIYYRPTVVEALESIQVLMQEINFGWFIRTLHRWSSGLMVLSILLHITRVYITSGFLKPRELTWISGVLSSLVTLVFGLTGYSLPWDQTGYWACKIVSAVPQGVDSILQGVGTFLLLCIRSGFSVSQFTLSRFYSLHALLLPLVLFVLVLFHFWLLRKQGISGPS